MQRRQTVAILLASLVFVSACIELSEDGRNPPLTGDGSVTERSSFPPSDSPQSWQENGCLLDPELLTRIKRGYYQGRSPDVIYVPREPNQFPNNHSGPWDYLQQVPLVLYGPGFIAPRGGIELERDVTVADLAPTIAELLQEPLPEADGRSLSSALLPERRRPKPPRLILTIVWDGGGWSGLDAWPAAWPQLKRLSMLGTSFPKAVVGSSPSITPAVHTTIGTGSFPSTHGIVDILQRHDGRMISSYAGRSATYLEIPTLADLYDARLANQPKIGMIAYKSWHLGMIGHGASYQGGDKDIAVLVDQSGHLVTNPLDYSLPAYLEKVEGLDQAVADVDASDGARDMRWMGNDVLRDQGDLRDTPVWVRHQTTLLEELIAREGFGKDATPDLLFVNYKQIDQVGHRWGMLEPEMRNIIAATDSALAEITDYLNKEVGERRWMIAITADHGPAPDLPAKQGWPIHMPVLEANLEDRLGSPIDEIFLDQRAQGIWLRPKSNLPAGVSEHAIADFIINYQIQDDVPPDDQLPPEFADFREEPVFSAAFPESGLEKLLSCATGEG